MEKMNKILLAILMIIFVQTAKGSDKIQKEAAEKYAYILKRWYEANITDLRIYNEEANIARYLGLLYTKDPLSGRYLEYY